MISGSAVSNSVAKGKSIQLDQEEGNGDQRNHQLSVVGRSSRSTHDHAASNAFSRTWSPSLCAFLSKYRLESPLVTDRAGWKSSNLNDVAMGLSPVDEMAFFRR